MMSLRLLARRLRAGVIWLLIVVPLACSDGRPADPHAHEPAMQAESSKATSTTAKEEEQENAPAAAEAPGDLVDEEDWPYPVPESEIARYTAYRALGPIEVDGRLDEASWQAAPRSPRFTDLETGAPTVHDTYAAVTWDDEYLYVGFWLEEPNVHAERLNRDSAIYSENDVEVFIAGADAYYEFEMNAYGTIYEVFFIWEEAYEQGGYAQEPTLARDHPQTAMFHGLRFKPHPRGPRVACFGWDFPGLKKGVFVDGTLNSEADRDRGWTAELAFPWEGMKWLAVGDGRTLPPEDGDVWRIDFSRFNYYREAPHPPSTDTSDTGGWVWSPHRVYDSHVPEVYPFITFSTQPIPPASTDSR